MLWGTVGMVMSITLTNVTVKGHTRDACRPTTAVPIREYIAERIRGQRRLERGVTHGGEVVGCMRRDVQSDSLLRRLGPGALVLMVK